MNAHTKTIYPPSKPGTIYAVIEGGYSAFGSGQSITTTVMWGSWVKRPFLTLKPGSVIANEKYGAVLKMEHTKSDSYPVTVTVQSRAGAKVAKLYQGAAPSEWNNKRFTRATL